MRFVHQSMTRQRSNKNHLKNNYYLQKLIELFDKNYNKFYICYLFFYKIFFSRVIKYNIFSRIFNIRSTCIYVEWMCVYIYMYVRVAYSKL